MRSTSRCSASSAWSTPGNCACAAAVMRTATRPLPSSATPPEYSSAVATSPGSAHSSARAPTTFCGGEGPDVPAAAVRTGPGLDLLPNVLIDMHFAARGRLPRLLSAVALDRDYLGVGIDENTAILVEGDHFEVLGTGVATVADAERATVVHPD